MNQEKSFYKKTVRFVFSGLLLVAFMSSSFIPVSAQANQQSGCTSWNLASDFRISPNQENPNRDSCGNLGVWEFMGSAGLTRNVQSYYTLTKFNPNWNSISGLNMWGGNRSDWLALLGYNASGATRTIGSVVWPANTIDVHPAPDQLAIIAWESPISGYVSVTGGVADLDAGGGNGIQWYIDKNTANIASGFYNNGGSQTFANGTNGANLNTLSVSIGDVLYIAIHPNGSHTFDSTRVDLSINVTSAPTATPTPTLTATLTSTPTATMTPTVTYTPTTTSTNTPTFTPSATTTNTSTFTPTATPTSTPTNTPIPSWYTGNDRTDAYGVKALISAPVQAPSLDNVSWSGQSNWVSIPEPYWLQAGWHYYRNWAGARPFIEWKMSNPPPGQEPHDFQEYYDDLQAWGTSKQYHVEWIAAMTWCGKAGDNTSICKSIGVLPPIRVYAHSEVHASSLNELNTLFSDVSFKDANNDWHLFDQGIWWVQSPYSVDIYSYWQFLNHGP